MKEIFDQAQQEFAGVGVLTLELPKPIRLLGKLSERGTSP